MRQAGTITQRPMLPASQRGGWRRLMLLISQRLSEMAEKRRSRRALMALSDEQLRDIGLSRADAYEEAIKPFWD